MRIGNLLENSLIDWEGKITTVIFTKGCNFRCGYCHNPSLVIPELINSTEDIQEDTVFSYLKNRKKWLDGVVISGGEPTIHNDLPDFIIKIKELGFNIKLDTNGTNPEMLKKLIKEGLVDFIAMDVKTIIKSEDYKRITYYNDPELIGKIEKSIKTLKSSNIQYQFRTTILPQVHSEDILDQLQNIFRNDPYIKQYFRNGITVGSINLIERG